MFFKKNKTEELKEEPLGYWEKESYMQIVPETPAGEFLDSMCERVSKIEGVEILEESKLTQKEPGRIRLKYDGEEYEVGYYPSRFSLPEMYINRNYFFTENEAERLRKAEGALTIFMEFRENSKKSYHLQLKIAAAMIPSLIGIMDESAEKMLPPSWVKMAAESKVLPAATDLFTVQAVSSESGEVWLHTHGLCRCGVTELEILQSDRENYNNHYNLISTLASYLLDKRAEPGESAYIGVLSDRRPVVAAYVPWTEGLGEYKNLGLGGLSDRQDGHRSKTSIIFIYQSEEDENQGKLSKVSVYNDLWGDNPIFFISDEETDRMKALAEERFDFVKEAAKNEENKIIIKIGLHVDNAGSGHDREHIWFELIGFEGDKFRAKLIQEPYDVKDMHEGDEGLYTVSDITDWIIYTPDFAVNPGTAYLLKR